VSRYQKGKTNLDFIEARDSEWQWHQLGSMQVCTLLQTDNHASTPPLSFLQAGCPSCHPTNSVKALKDYRYMRRVKTVKEKVHQVMTENGQLTNTEEETAQSLGNFFSSVFVKECIGNTDTDEKSGMSRNSVRLVIDEDIVMNKLLKLKVDKAQGPDDIHPSVLRNCV